MGCGGESKPVLTAAVWQAMRFECASRVLLIALLGLVITSCAENKESRGVYKVGQPYQIEGVWYYPREDQFYDETGIASWYGSDFHGKTTANGELYDAVIVGQDRVGGLGRRLGEARRRGDRGQRHHMIEDEADIRTRGTVGHGLSLAFTFQACRRNHGQAARHHCRKVSRRQPETQRHRGRA